MILIKDKKIYQSAFMKKGYRNQRFKSDLDNFIWHQIGLLNFNESDIKEKPEAKEGNVVATICHIQWNTLHADG